MRRCRRRRSGPRDEISRRSARPSVVLPEPLSPTTPSVWPSRTVELTPSTALTWPTVRRSTPRLIGNQTFRSVGLDHDRRGADRRRGRRASARRRAAAACRDAAGASKIVGDGARLDDLALAS